MAKRGGLWIVGGVLVAVGFANFIAFWIFCMKLGGSAGNGGERDGRFYVNDHGKEREVTREAFEANRWHARSVWISHPLAALGILILGATDPKRRSRE